MSIIPRLLLVLIFLCLASVASDAQFLGQQSLSESSYVIDQSGQLWVWGRNLYAQLGLGDRVDRDTPCIVPLPLGASRWTLVSGGPNFTLAVADSDKLYAWGLNDRGQIGLGQAGGLYGAPMRIPNPLWVRNWKWVSAGTRHSEALTEDGRLYAWGDNAQGQLGVGNTKYLPSPELVEFPTGVTAWTAVAAGPGYTMMIAQNGLLFGCGIDSLGAFQPWEGPIQVSEDTFRAYSPLTCIAASNRLESRIDQSYSLNDYGLFGLTDDSGVAPYVAEVADGGAHYLLLTEEGKIAAGGDNFFGQLTITRYGNVFDTFSNVIVPFPAGVSQFVAVAAGLKHSLAIGNDGWLYAWGDDSAGELGIGPAPNQGQPVKVLKVCPPLSLSASFTAPIRSTGPFPIGITVKNTNSASPLTNPNAFLVPGEAVMYAGSAPDTLLQSPLPPKDTSHALWNMTVGPQIFTDSIFSPDYFAYIQANGSAPLFVVAPPGTMPSGPWRLCDNANVEDTFTHAPLAGAELVNPGPPPENAYIGVPFDSNKMISTDDGVFSLCFKGPVTSRVYCPFPGLYLLRGYPIAVMRENYETQIGIIPQPIQQQITFLLAPSDIQGMFASITTPLIANNIQKVYYPDSMIGYGISQRGIFRTMDSGVTWSAMYEAAEDLHDLKFVDAAHGWAVGDMGAILATTDSGETWQAAPGLTTQNLRAICMTALDTGWAVGNDGTLLKKAGTAWSALPKLGIFNLSCIHFLDPSHGVIGGDNVYYLYDGKTWAEHTIAANLKAVYYTAPGQFYMAGDDGIIIHYNDSNFVCLDLDNFPPDSIVDTVTFDSTYTTQTINSLYFLNENSGFAMGDSGSSFVTYDGGQSWANMLEFSNTATSVNFFSLEGHAATQNAVLNYDGKPNFRSGIVRGRITYGNPPEPIVGAEVDRMYIKDTFTYFMEPAFTNDQGNFVFTGLDSIFPYAYVVTFTDSGITKTHTFANVTARGHGIITLDYNDYAPPPPPPDTILSVSASSPPALSLDVSASLAFAHIAYMIPSDGPVRLILQDILGRTLRVLANGYSASGQQVQDISIDDLPDGAYYLTLTSGQGSITKKFVVLR